MLSIVVVDLDGTLIKGNSLHVYIKCGLKKAVLDADIPVLFKILCALSLRKLRLINHFKMKSIVLKAIFPCEKIRVDFTKKINGLRRISLLRKLEQDKKEGKTIILATAAPDIYVPWIWNGVYFASEVRNGKLMKECRGEEKALRVRTFADKSKGSVNAVYTDHYDDIPLMRLSQDKVFLVEPDGNTRTRLEQTDIKFTEI